MSPACRLLALFLWLGMAAAGAAPGASSAPQTATPSVPPSTVRVGMLAPEGRFDALRSWEFMQPYLAQALPELTVQVRHLDHAAMRAAIGRGEIDFFVANSGFYVEAEAEFGASPLATLDSPYALSPREAIATTFVRRADRTDLRSLADLKGQRVVAVHPLAFGGYQLGLHSLAVAGVSRSELSSLKFTGQPPQRLLALLASGAADAAILRSCLLESLVNDGVHAAADYVVVGAVPADRYGCGRSSALYPDWPFAMLPHVDPARAKRVSMALLAMPRTDTGYAWTVATDYSSVHRVFRDLEIGPYAYLGQRTLGGLVHKYRWWLTLALLGLAGGAAHIVRAESLVRRRTRQLQEALAERERVEQEARARDRQLEHLSRLGILGEMSTMLAHELNQPLSAIANYARGIVRRVQAGRADANSLTEAGDQIARQAERAAGIMQRVRDFARKRPSERVEVDLRDVVQETLALFRDLVPAAPAVEHVLDANCAGSALVWVDRLQLSQVLLNLLKNAHDAMREVPAAERRIRIHCRREPGALRIEVSDNGAGLKDLPVHALFEPFCTTKSDGIGLGLAICKRVVEAHGGQISGRSNDPEPGITVSFTLPEQATPMPETDRAELAHG